MQPIPILFAHVEGGREISIRYFEQGVPQVDSQNWPTLYRPVQVLRRGQPLLCLSPNPLGRGFPCFRLSGTQILHSNHRAASPLIEETQCQVPVQPAVKPTDLEVRYRRIMFRPQQCRVPWQYLLYPPGLRPSPTRRPKINTLSAPELTHWIPRFISDENGLRLVLGHNGS